MNEPSDAWRGAVEALSGEILQRVGDRARPLMVAIDGRSGSGKSTLAALVAPAVDGVIVPADDFFAASMPALGWMMRTAAERAADVMEWGRFRAEALEPLRAGRAAQWHAFDFAAGARTDGSYGMRAEPTTRPPSRVILVEGAYSAAPPLADLIDLAVLIEAPQSVREARLVGREHADTLTQWHVVWDGVEDYYFGVVRPAGGFDLVFSSVREV